MQKSSEIAAQIVEDSASVYDFDLQSVLLEDITKAIQDDRERIWRLAYSTACAGCASDYCLTLIQQLAEYEDVTIEHLREPVEKTDEQILH